MSYESGDLVPQTFARDDSDLFSDTLVGVEVECQPGVVFLDDQPAGSFHGLRSYTSHVSSNC